MHISLFKYNQLKIEKSTPIYKISGPSIKLTLIFRLFIILFNFVYVHMTNSGLNKYIYIKNSSDNLTNPFMIK